MNVEERIALYEAALVNLSALRTSAARLGDATRVQVLDAEIGATVAAVQALRAEQ